MTLNHPTRDIEREIRRGDWRDARRDFNQPDVERDEMEVDVLLVGAGPANLAAAIRLQQLVVEHNARIDAGADGEKLEPEIMVLEKSAGLGNHNLSGAVMNPVAFRELFGEQTEIPGAQPVTDDGFVLLTRQQKLRLWPLPPLLSNAGNVILSISQLVRFMGEKAEEAGVNVMPGFAASRVLIEDGRVVGVQTRDAGIDRDGKVTDAFEPGINLKARHTLIGEGTRGTLARQLEREFDTHKDSEPQSYALGVKEIWRVKPEKHQAGHVWHTLGWPLSAKRQVGGGWVYHMADNLVSIGLVSRLDYDDPLFDPFDEFQRQKLHPWISDLLEGAEIVEYGAKTIPEGGWFAMPELALPGALLLGDSGGMLNGFKLKGIHYAMKSGMLAAQRIYDSLVAGTLGTPEGDASLKAYATDVKQSYIGKELYKVRKFHAALVGNLPWTMIRVGALIATGGHLLLGPKGHKTDHGSLRDQAKSDLNKLPADERELPQEHPLIFDRATALYYSDTAHEENQPAHLVVGSTDICSDLCWEQYGSPCIRYCPAEVYEMSVDDTGKASLILHPSNCVHCKTCDIKDPFENVLWVVPESMGGPGYKRT